MADKPVYVGVDLATHSDVSVLTVRDGEDFHYCEIPKGFPYRFLRVSADGFLEGSHDNRRFVRTEHQLKFVPVRAKPGN